MGTLLELGRNALEGVEVLMAFCTVAALGAGLMWGHGATADGDEQETARRQG